jgi:transcriptional regulator with XRE-family HTH domain
MAHDPSPLTREIQEMLLGLMNAQGLSNSALARQAGVPTSTVSRILAFDRIPSTDLVDQLFQAMGLEVHVDVR